MLLTHDLSLIGILQVADYSKQGRFSGTVGADQAYPVPWADRQINVAKERPGPVHLAEAATTEQINHDRDTIFIPPTSWKFICSGTETIPLLPNRTMFSQPGLWNFIFIYSNIKNRVWSLRGISTVVLLLLNNLIVKSINYTDFCPEGVYLHPVVYVGQPSHKVVWFTNQPKWNTWNE
jgi:hypothetical protein